MENQIAMTANEEYDPMQFTIAGITGMLVGLVSFIFGIAIFGGLFVAGILGLFSIAFPLPEFFGSIGLQGLLALVTGFVLYRTSKAIKKHELWAFSTSLYINIFAIVVFVSTSYPVVLLALLPLIPLLMLFLPNVKTYWYPTFREDITPRIKELKFSLRLVAKSPLVVAGIIILLVFVLFAILAPYIAPYGPEERLWSDGNLPPLSPSNQPGRPDHIWGTDNSGGDVYSRILYGAQIDLQVSITVVIVAVTIGSLIGAVAGYYGGKIDELVMRITDIFFAFPGLILAMAIVMALGERSLQNVSVALMITWWPTYARLVRGQVLAEREKLYVEAARSIGASDTRILLVHILPNTIQPLTVQATMDTGSVLLVAAGLSFIGFGPPAGIAEWGWMIATAQLYFTIAPWAVFFPGFAILFVALAFNLVGDGIRDILDPKLRRR